MAKQCRHYPQMESVLLVCTFVQILILLEQNKRKTYPVKIHFHVSRMIKRSCTFCTVSLLLHV
uniref:Uncharacterized protein n=1 Tax=Anguilla anguilla TaxID=7936 RepID=A0A0E9XWC0_ANGAN